MIDYAPRVIAGFEFHMQTLYMTWITMAVIIAIMYFATRNLKIVPDSSSPQNVVEMIIDMLDDLMNSNMGDKGRNYMAPYIITLFLFIFIGNELGLLPTIGLAHFHWTSPTNDVNTTLGLAAMVILSVQIVGCMQNGIKYLGHFFYPHWLFFPVVVLDEAAKAATMGFRLFGNILAGEILLIVLNMLAPYIVPDFWILFSLVVGFLQALIFSILTMSHFAAAFRTGH